MDRSTFDQLTRAMATGQSRRSFVRRLFGVALGTSALRFGITQAFVEPPEARGNQNSFPTPNSTPTGARGTTLSTGGKVMTCVAPSIAGDCGCLDPATQVCCDNDICTGYCYGEDLCCPAESFCPGLGDDRCCAPNERCCGTGTFSNNCIPAGDDSCCDVGDCALAFDACLVSCEAGICRQHICNDGAVCCADDSGNVGCVLGNCCNDANCGAGEACLDGSCTAVECFTDNDCLIEDTCSIAICQDGSCGYSSLCEGECSTCTDGICSTDDTLCDTCEMCDDGQCIPVVCAEGYSCYEATGECLGIA